MKTLAVLLFVLLFAVPALAEGGGGAPYVIDDLETLTAFRDAVNAGESYSGEYVRLDADIELNSAEWVPIGTGYTNVGALSESEFAEAKANLYTCDEWGYAAAPQYEEGAYYYRLYAFCGTFDGNGHVISGLSSSVSDGISGLFGCVHNGTVKNLDVFSSYVYGHTAGGVAGRLEYGTIYNCRFEGEVTGTEAAGGIVGQAVGIPISGEPQSELTECVNCGSVTAPDGSAGGIAGACVATDFLRCANTGKIMGDSAGGILGYYNAGSVSSCITEGSVYGNSYAGGIAGYWYTGLIEDCASLASVSGKGDVGGTVGEYSYINYDYEGTNLYMPSSVQPSDSKIGRPFEPDQDQIKQMEAEYSIPRFDKE
jgi:hypothetical protein